MDQDPTQAAANFARAAFDELRGEVSLLRRAVERLTDERTSVPDYAPTLAGIDKRIDNVADWARRVSERPGIKLSPQELASEITSAGAEARQRDAEALARARQGYEQAAQRIDSMIIRGRSAAEQQRWVLQNRIACLIAGILIWAIVPGAVARSLPVGWAVPERIAARMLGLDMWNAGQRMMATADPGRWHAFVERERAPKGATTPRR